jgi:putative Ca2+/H+ antiporter (TMEM165/GDT1 family)
VNFLTTAAVFAVVLPAELPDKTMIAALVLGTRFRPALVWFGVAAAFAAQVTIAVLAGGLVSLLPRALVGSIAAALFLIGAIVLIRTNDEGTEARHDQEEMARLAGPAPSAARVVTTGFVVVFVAEWGDLTQILTATLAARYHDPVSVWIGAFVALAAVGAIGVFAGQALTRVIALSLLRRIAAGLLLVLAMITVAEVVVG